MRTPASRSATRPARAPATTRGPDTPLRRARTGLRTTIGLKALMAATGVILLAYVIGHALGNLKVYAGPEKYNEYAEWLRVFGAPAFGNSQALWIVRIILLAALVLHVWSAAVLTRRSRAARGTDYAREEHIEFSYASRTMRWGGVAILLFVIYHILHLTTGTVHPEFVPGDVYHNFVTGFDSWPVSLVYVAAMVALGFHIYHGIWGGMQTLGLNDPRYNRYRRPFAATVAWLIVLVNVSFPVAVLAGVLP